jgi:hypothetical protein
MTFSDEVKHSMIWASAGFLTIAPSLRSMRRFGRRTRG